MPSPSAYPAPYAYWHYPPSSAPPAPWVAYAPQPFLSPHSSMPPPPPARHFAPFVVHGPLPSLTPPSPSPHLIAAASPTSYYPAQQPSPFYLRPYRPATYPAPYHPPPPPSPQPSTVTPSRPPSVPVSASLIHATPAPPSLPLRSRAPPPSARTLAASRVQSRPRACRHRCGCRRMSSSLSAARVAAHERNPRVHKRCIPGRACYPLLALGANSDVEWKEKDGEGIRETAVTAVVMSSAVLQALPEVASPAPPATEQDVAVCGHTCPCRIPAPRLLPALARTSHEAVHSLHPLCTSACPRFSALNHAAKGPRSGKEAPSGQSERQVAPACPPSPSSSSASSEMPQLTIPADGRGEGRRASTSTSESPRSPLTVAETVALEYPQKTLAESGDWGGLTAVVASV